jgi:peptidyl-prolyl cis-trans isomerase A (cyclophilin A)
MAIRFALLSALVLALAPLQAQVPPATSPAAATIPRPATVRVTLQTSEGPIVLELEKERAPVTTANFLRYVDGKRLDGINFYRAMKVAPGTGLIQGGVREASRLFPPIAHEPTTQTGLSHVDGAISMARHAPGSATADFFIIVGRMASLDANPQQPGDNLGFAVFGRVVHGMDVVRRILDAPTSPTEGEGVMKGQMLANPIRIVTARRAGA